MRANLYWNTEDFWSETGRGPGGMWTPTMKIGMPEGATFTVLEDGPLDMDGYTNPMDAVGCAMTFFMQHGKPVRVMMDSDDETDIVIFGVAQNATDLKKWINPHK